MQGHTDTHQPVHTPTSMLAHMCNHLLIFGAHGVVHLSALFNEVDACQIPVRVLILQAGVSSCACACVRQRIGCMQKLAVARTSVHQHTTTRYARRTRAHSHARLSPRVCHGACAGTCAMWVSEQPGPAIWQRAPFLILVLVFQKHVQDSMDLLHGTIRTLSVPPPTHT